MQCVSCGQGGVNIAVDRRQADHFDFRQLKRYKYRHHIVWATN